MSQRRVGMKTHLEVQACAEKAKARIAELEAENKRILGSHDAYAARYEDELLDRKSAEALAADHENQIAELTAGLDQAEGRVAELEGAASIFEDHYERSTCQHEITHRGGAIWEICDSCGAKWADDEGGFKPFEYPEDIVHARQALAGDGSRIMDVVRAAAQFCSCIGTGGELGERGGEPGECDERYGALLRAVLAYRGDDETLDRMDGKEPTL